MCLIECALKPVHLSQYSSKHFESNAFVDIFFSSCSLCIAATWDITSCVGFCGNSGEVLWLECSVNMSFVLD